MSKYYSNDNHSHRNYKDDLERTDRKANSEIIVRKATAEELAKFQNVKKEHIKKRTMR